jgi:hypothetical protein
LVIFKFYENVFIFILGEIVNMYIGNIKNYDPSEENIFDFVLGQQKQHAGFCTVV